MALSPESGLNSGSARQRACGIQSGIAFLGFRSVSDFQGLRVSEFHSLRVSVSEFQSLRVSESQSLRVSESQSSRVSESQSSTISESQSSRVPESQSSRVSERQKAKVRKRPKSRKKTRFRLKTSQGRARSCENGAFGTEIVRGILGEKNLGLKPPKKRKLQNPFFFLIFRFKKRK